MNQQTKVIHEFLNSYWNDKSGSDKAPVYESFSENLIINSPLGKNTGLSELQIINSQWDHAFPDMHVSDINIEIFGDVVVSTWMSSATHLNCFKDIHPQGKKICYQGETLFFFQDKKIVRYSCKIDLMEIYKQLGYFIKNEEYKDQALCMKNRSLLIDKIRGCSDGNLTSRETQCLSLYLMGFTSKQIAKILFISPRTVETHLQRGLNEMGCFSKQQCHEKMIEEGFLPLWQDLGKILLRVYENK